MYVQSLIFILLCFNLLFNSRSPELKKEILKQLGLIRAPSSLEKKPEMQKKRMAGRSGGQSTLFVGA